MSRDSVYSLWSLIGLYPLRTVFLRSVHMAASVLDFFFLYCSIIFHVGRDLVSFHFLAIMNNVSIHNLS